MSRPQSEAEYLAGFSTAPVSGFTRRNLLRGAAGIAAVSALPALSACGGEEKKAGMATATGEVTFGNSQADEAPLRAVKAYVEAFQKKNQGLTVKMNTVAHTTFQENINNYLQGSPDDVFAWFAGYRAKFFAQKGLVGDLSEAYAATEGIPAAMKKACSTDDGKQIVIPATYYPWVVLYRKSTFKKYGYEVPKTLDQLKALGQKMTKDGLVPFAFADKDGWEAMGMFDILNMRQNGYDFHMSLCAGKEDWTSDKVAKVFDTWKGMLDMHQPDALGRTWQEAAQTLQKGKAGMYYLGCFAAQQFAQGAEQDDLDFFPFPEIDSTIGASAIEAPTDGFMMSKRPKNEAGAKKFLSFLGSAEAELISVTSDSSAIAVNEKVDTAKYTGLQQKMLTVTKEAKEVAQFFDRDSRPDFASTAMGPAIQGFLKNPADISSILKKLEEQKKSIFTA